MTTALDFDDALPALRRGHCVRRSIWLGKLRIDFKAEVIWYVWESGKETLWIPTQEDLLAGDWEVAK